jgi:hypothetical protein
LAHLHYSATKLSTTLADHYGDIQKAQIAQRGVSTNGRSTNGTGGFFKNTFVTKTKNSFHSGL